MTTFEQAVSSDSSLLLRCFRETRQLTLELVAPLRPEDFRIQSMPDVSPPWWNLGHTTWFFAKNILEPRLGRRLPSGFDYALNSYYETHGERLPRAERGLATRPTTASILDFRAEVDEAIEALLVEIGDNDPDLLFLIRTGVHHEQQHQELLMTEIKHILGHNPPPLREPYCADHVAPTEPGALRWIEHPGGLQQFGNLDGGWAWDNEEPVHRAFNEPFALQNRLISVGEYLEFVHDGGYQQPLLWLANGWQAVDDGGWKAPLYWEVDGDPWRLWTLAGQRPLEPHEPVCHLSFYEADAYASWRARTYDRDRDARLPTEREWEQAARTWGFDIDRGNFLEDRHFHARSAGLDDNQLAGDLWEWTSSHYDPYPGYRPFSGDLMEYNGKFMDNQRVLRGGSCVTPRSHIRPSYRNFWHPTTRFQFTGVRLAKSL